MTPNRQYTMNNSTMATTRGTKSITAALSNPTTLLISLLLLLLIIIILVGNFVICFTIFATKRLHLVTFCFVASLAISDFMVGSLVVPVALVFQVAIEMNETSVFSVQLCDFWIFANIWFCSASILNLCSISWDRYIAITSPLRYGARMNKTTVRQLLLFVWMGSFCLSILSFIGIKLSKNRIHYCSTAGMNIEFAVALFLVLFGFPVIFLVFANAKIITAAQGQLRKIKAQSNLSLSAGNSEGRELREDFTVRRTALSLQRRLESLRIGTEIRTFKLFLIVIGVFVICWLPYFIHLVLSTIKPLDTPDNIKLIFISLIYINSACNVFIYGFLNRDFRRAIVSSAKSRGWSRSRAQSVSSISPRQGTLERELGTENNAYGPSTLPR